MKALLLAGCLMFITLLPAQAQTLLEDCGQYDHYVREGKKASMGRSPNFPLAIQYFRAALDCKPSRARSVDTLLVAVFNQINRQKLEVIAQKDKAEKKAEELRKEKQTTSLFQLKTLSEAMALSAKDSFQYNPVKALTRAAAAYQMHRSAVTMSVLMEAYQMHRYTADQPLDAAVTTLTVAPSQRKIAMARAGSRIIYLYDSLTGPPRELYGHEGDVQHLAFSPDGNYLVSASADRTLKLWTSGGDFIRTLRGEPSLVKGIGFSADSRSIVTGSKDGVIRRWSVEGQFLQQPPDPALLTIDFFTVSPKGQMLAVGSDQKLFYGTGTGPLQFMRQLATDAAVLAVGLAPDGRSFVVSDTKRRIYIFNERGEIKEQFTVGSHVVGSYFLNDQGTIALTTDEGPVLLYENRPGAEMIPLIGHQNRVTALCRVGADMWSAGSDKTMKQWPYIRPQEPFIFVAKTYDLKEEEHIHTRDESPFELVNNSTDITISQPEEGNKRSTTLFRHKRLDNATDTTRTGGMVARWDSLGNKLFLTMLNPETGKAAELIKVWKISEKGACRVAFSEDGNYLLVKVLPLLNTNSLSYRPETSTYEDQIKLLLFRTPPMIHKLAYLPAGGTRKVSKPAPHP